LKDECIEVVASEARTQDPKPMMGAFIVRQEFSLGINSQNHH
jgi:hypothetical protein